MQRLQELDVEKSEPILLRCSALQRTRFVQIDALQRTSEIHEILHEFHSAASQLIIHLHNVYQFISCLLLSCYRYFRSHKQCFVWCHR